MDYDAVAMQFGRIARHLLTRRDEDEEYKKCHPRPDIDLCEKPASADKSTPIVIGSIVGVLVFGTLAVLTFFHFRRKRKDKEEWPKSQQELEDYGFAIPAHHLRQPQNTYHQDQPQQQQQQQPQQRHEEPHAMSDDHQRPAHGSLDNLERSLRGGAQPARTTGAFNHRDEQISADMKPVEPSDRI
ncbi:hypothetical protein GGS20DRAFT_21060 [Poronia punctata]|nr:hypothetical protein GGS20DRAFT_21060 [Poronia punctata]